MVNILYSVIDIVFIIVLTIILAHDFSFGRSHKKIGKSYIILIISVIAFFLQDAIWGYFAGPYSSDKSALFVSSTVFHISTVFITFFWLQFVLYYLENYVKHVQIYLFMEVMIVSIQIVLLTLNFMKPIVFYVNESGEYVVGAYRYQAFLNQYLGYVMVGVIAIIAIFKNKGEARSRFHAVLMFSLGQIVSGIFQFFFVDAPYHSIGYFIGCIIIHIFIVTSERNELQCLQYKDEINEQKKLATTDKLTGLLNRRAYEEVIKEYETRPIERDFIYISIDLNGLKAINDNYGHPAGDEAIAAVAEIINNTLGLNGKVFRIGGDEFVAMIYSSLNRLQVILSDMDNSISNWKGNLVNDISISYGCVSKAENLNAQIKDITVLADQRMYKNKDDYYQRRGIDRKERQNAYNIICKLYKKILKVNLTYDTYDIIYIDEKELSSEMGKIDNISSWMREFGVMGQIDKKDLADYLKLTDITYLKEHFKSGRELFSIIYRRLENDEYRKTMLEMVPADEYNHDNQVVYLYVKYID